MKKFKYIALSMALVFGMSSCNEYLDVNTDMDNPTSTSATVNTRLPWIQNYFAYAWGTAGMRSCTAAGLLTQTSTTSGNGLIAAWNPTQGICTTVYQNWYIGAGVNIDPMIEKAKENGAYSYMGAGYCIKAMGFMMMLDLHGELPLTEAYTGKYNPTYDDGKTMYYACMDYLDKAIESFSKTQETTAPSFAEGDLWNGGDVSKWLKLCYGLKARYLLKLSKKSDLFDPNAILAALEKAQTSNSDNTIMKHYNVEGDETNFTVSDPYQTNVFWNSIGYGSTSRVTRWYISMLDNSFSNGSGVIDPRLSKLVPAMMSNVVLDQDGNIKSYVWRRDKGVDMMNSDIRQRGAIYAAAFATSADVAIKYTIADNDARNKFVADASNIHKVSVSGNIVTVTYQKGSAYCNSTNYKDAVDTVYVSTRSNSMSTSGRSITDLFYYPSVGYNYVAGTGTFYARPNSDSDILTYAEMCFIKAEVYFRTGKKDDAWKAYQAGIKAHFDRMQTKLTKWKSDGSKNPDEMPMNEADITAYLNSSAVCQSSGTLTMAEIMRQKMIALGYDMEIWNDMRRFNYSVGNIDNFGTVYVDYKRPQEFSATNKITGSSPTDLTYWIRRFSQSSHESNYNLTQLLASNKFAMQDPIWSCPVWWDCTTDAEYYGYIKK